MVVRMNSIPTPTVNRQVRLKSRPEGIPQADHFEIVDAPLAPLGAGEVRVRNAWLSVEPAMRGWVNAIGNYSEPVAVGAVMRSFAAGVVEASDDAAWPVGTPVTGLFGWQDYALLTAASGARRVADRGLPLSTALGVLGINGATAHHGLLHIGEPKPGQTVVVSTAAGAVGSCVGQIARLKGCRAVGIAGGETKRRLCVDEFGFDVAIDYKAPDFAEQLARACPDGVDVYFDNTSGVISDTVMSLLALNARVVICGTAAVANWNPAPLGPRVERHLLVKRARMQGFVIFDHDDVQEAAFDELAQWIRAGRIRYLEDVLDGMEHAPDAIAGLYRGENLGKRLIRLAER
jgi:NADPH-dependent curcumin reductase CurA